MVLADGQDGVIGLPNEHEHIKEAECNPIYPYPVSKIAKVYNTVQAGHQECPIDI